MDYDNLGPCVCGFGNEFMTIENNRSICTVCGGLVGKSALPGEDLHLPRKTVLIVDDQAFFRERISEGLAEQGHEVLQASSGLEGIKVVSDIHLSHPPGRLDAVILDLVMPGDLDGFQTLAVIKKLYPELPVIILTATPPQKELFHKLAQRGAKKYLNKAAPNLDELVLKNIQEV
jgi:CheY-like chemotaxis protein